MNHFYQTVPDLSVSGLSANCQLLRVRHTPMKRRLFLLLLTSMLSTSITIVGARTAYASSNDDDDDDQDYDHEGDEEEATHDEQGIPTQNTTEISSPENEDADDPEEDHQQALEAVRTHEAIPFKEIIGIFEKQFSGKIVDVSIYQKRGQLVYRFKYIDPSGHVLIAIYQAATGIYLGT